MLSISKVKAPVTGDLNGDNIVDIFDVVIWGNAFGTKQGDPNYNPAADLYLDNQINILDGIIIAQHFGQTDP